MNEISLPLKTPPEVDALIVQFKTIENKLTDNENKISSSNLLCPICQDGHLAKTERGKLLGLFADEWLICNKCSAEFDKKINKAQLIKSTADPFGVYKQYADQTLSLDKWRDIASGRLKAENYDYNEQLEAIKTKLSKFVLQQFADGKIKLIVVDITGFILKTDEYPIFATQAEVIEERRRKVTQRTTTGGGRRIYQGFSFRIAKGFYSHSGVSFPATPRQTTVQSTEYAELVSADCGDFLITNQRILFKGSRSRGLAIPIHKLAAIDVDPDEQALLIIQENKKPVILKLATKFYAMLSDIKVHFSINLDHIVSIVKVS